MKTGRKRLRAALIDLGEEVIIFAVILIIIFRFIFGITVQSGNDMYPDIHDGDLLLFYRHPGLELTEPVVYKHDGSVRTGRICAKEGSVISRTDGGELAIDGIFMPEDRKNGNYYKTMAAGDEELPLTIGRGKFFILCDNREKMEDSRVYGEIDKEEILGRIVIVLRSRI